LHEGAQDYRATLELQVAHEQLQAEDEEVKAPSNRNFGLTFAVVFLVIGTLPLIRSGGVRWWAWVMAGVFGAITWLRPQWLTAVNRWWLKFGLLLGHIVAPVAMGILFYLVITPIGLLMRLAGKAGMRAPFDGQAASYWLPREPPGPAPDSMKNQF
jgi:hypothetical protein